jgi:SPP1 family predicted phage head-tail adaptor
MLAVKQDIGKLDKRITIQTKIIGDNISNEDQEDGWEDFKTVYASRDDRTGNEMYAADKLTGFQDAVFTIRWRNDINLTMRIISDGMIYDIRSIQEVSRKRFLTVIAERGKEYVESGGDDSWVLSSGTWDDEEHWDDEGIWNDGV